MRINPLIKKRFNDVLEPFGIEYIESVLEVGCWRCIASHTDFENNTNTKSYDIEMLLDQDDYYVYFERELDKKSLLYKMRNILNILTVDAEEVEKDRVKITFSTQSFFIEGRC